MALTDDLWCNLGVDAFSAHIVPQRLWPGIGLRPGGDRPDLEVHLRALFDALYTSVATLSHLGVNVVVDVGHHDDYSEPLGILPRVATLISALPAYLIGVRCPVPVIMDRRNSAGAHEDRYERSGPGDAVPDIVVRWERAVHDPGIYDLEVDTSILSPDGCVEAIRARIARGSPTAFAATGEHGSCELTHAVFTPPRFGTASHCGPGSGSLRGHADQGQQRPDAPAHQ